MASPLPTVIRLQIDKAFEALVINNVGCALVWDGDVNKVPFVLFLRDYLPPDYLNCDVVRLPPHVEVSKEWTIRDLPGGLWNFHWGGGGEQGEGGKEDGA